MEDTRCCGTGTCLINAEGYCWCGQRWDGSQMCFPQASETGSADTDPTALAPTVESDGSDR